MEIIGNKGRSERFTITDKRNVGQKQTFTFTNFGDLGDVTSLYVELVVNDGWNFEYIIVKNTNTGDEYTFKYNSWIDGDDPKYQSNATLYLSQ